MRPRCVRLPGGLEVWRHGCNAGLLRRDGVALLIGAPDPLVLERAGLHPEAIDGAYWTHADRTACPGLSYLINSEGAFAAPRTEAALFCGSWQFRDDGAGRLHNYRFHPSNRSPGYGLPVSDGVVPGDVVEWRGATLSVLPGDGPTDGGVSYLLEAGGPRVAFVGDLMCGHGRLREFHTLQGSRPLPGGGEMMEYHGFGERAERLLAALEAVLERKPDLMVGSYGPLVTRPKEAVATLRRRIEAAMAAYHATASARWYFAGVRPEWPADRSEGEARLRTLPGWVREVSPTSRLVVAPGGEALLIDCAGEAADTVAALQAEGAIRGVEALWVTHYHDDHVERVNEARNRFGCAVAAHQTLQGILEAPEAYLMPCLDPTPIPVDRVTSHGETWEWRGFRLTALDFPGQTALDAALLVERDGERVLFVGDSLTPGGLDDYCAPNRNHLGPGRGMDACLQTVASLPFPTLLVNQHCPGAFVFSQSDIRRLRAGLRARRARFRELLAWDDPNYGLDPAWVRLRPYYRRAQPGEPLEWTVEATNHGPRAVRGAVRWSIIGDWADLPSAEAGREITATLSGPAPWDRGVQCVVIDVVWNGRYLPAVAEAIVEVEPTA
ncbi:MAG: MBL fold metallo-hydrolase [Armatimonadetes bacterium]|nr:MBL fold metallo-hydrolase [Armatimonadota bacterium]